MPQAMFTVMIINTIVIVIFCVCMGEIDRVVINFRFFSIII